MVSTESSATVQTSGASSSGDAETVGEVDSGFEMEGESDLDSESVGSADEQADDGNEGADGDVETPRFDLLSIPDGPGHQEGCARVDFLFVIDNSGSMIDEQEHLRTSFPGFISAIEDTLELDDFHIMVIDTDEGVGKDSSVCQSDGTCTCMPEPECCRKVCDRAQTTTCNGTPCEDIDVLDCRAVLGAGRSHAAQRQDEPCDFADGHRYMTRADSMLEASFNCAALLGNGGDANERPMEGMLAAVSDELNADGACNSGFLRRDAILVVTVITDEEERGVPKSMGDPASWKRELVAAKHGNDKAIVMLGLIGDLDLPTAICEPLDTGSQNGAERSPRLREFVRSFEYGMDASVCSEDYSPFFREAVSVIDTACKDFDPPE